MYIHVGEILPRAMVFVGFRSITRFLGSFRLSLKYKIQVRSYIVQITCKASIISEA